MDQCIIEAGGEKIYKYCTGVMLFNDGIHLHLIDRLGELVELMFKLKDGKLPYPVPNPRIMDEYALWVVLSRIGVYAGLFGAQDVTQGYIEEKHEEFFNPIVLHYTTKGEQIMAQEDERFSNLLRDVDEYIKPAVSSDGGNILFDSYDKEKKLVKVILQGACSGCPSSTVTLKNGIENMLKEMLSDKVNSVEAING